MKHIVFFSGGIGSFYTAKRVIEQHGKENVILLFTDTKIEDEDLYRFNKDVENHFNVSITTIEDGRTPWELFKQIRFLGNSRIAQCSHYLKQKTAKKWIKKHFKPGECILYLGIDWTEEHRTHAPRKNWEPYKVEFPMCEEPLITKDEMLAYLEHVGIEIPRLYKLGFSHNNCGGMCVRAGQGHFANLYKQFPERFLWLENFEREMQEHLGKDVTILKRSVNNTTENYPLSKLREHLESDADYCQIDMFDVGGCGCFVTAE